MKKKSVHSLFSREKWGRYTLGSAIFFVLFHVLAFSWYQFLVYRYDTLYAEAVQDGTMVEMTPDFQKAHASASERNILTRPDIIAKEVGVLQSGIRSLTDQYHGDLYRKHDQIVQNIDSLRTIVKVSGVTIFPERPQVEENANYLETQLASDRSTRVDSLDELVVLSEEYLTKARADLERTEKNLVLLDIEGIKHEITFLDSVYRVNRDTVLSFDQKVFNKMYQEFFSAARLKTENSEQLRSSWMTLSSLLDPYRIESREIRKIAREKRAEDVAKEAEKWVGKKLPEAPFSDIYDQISISLRDQMMYVFEDGELILSTSITTGRRNYETVRGTFKVYVKQRNKLMKSPFPEEEYELWVDYWLGFYGGYGIHDACNSRDCWRTVFGASSYVYNGSHGCINTPYNAVKFIYNWASVGTTVHIQ